MKNVIVVGGSGGLGSKVSEALANNYVVTPLSSSQYNVRDFGKAQKIFQENLPDILINFSGVNYDRFIHKIDEEDLGTIQKLLDINTYGVVAMTAACLPGMRDRGYGRIIHISSVLSTNNVMGTAVYSSCKAFIDKFVKVASLENASKGVTVNSIQLGYMDGGMTYKLPDPDKIKNTLPLKRWGTADEIVNVIETIIKTEYITGANIALTGGI